MTTKLQPSELTSEERAIWDEMALDYWRMHFSWSCAYSYSMAAALEAAQARRAFFAPPVEASGKVCPNSDISYAPAQPEPEKVRVNRFLDGDSYVPAPCPTKGELPEAVKFLRGDGASDGAFFLADRRRGNELADALESWARSLPTPPASVMTPELERVLERAQAYANSIRNQSVNKPFCYGADVIEQEIAAVQAQAVAGEKPKMSEALRRILDYAEGAATFNTWRAPDDRVMLADVAAIRAEFNGEGR